MKLLTLLLVLATGLLATSIDSANPSPTSGGTFASGQTYTVTTTGVANLLALSGGFYLTNPDGTLASPVPDTDFWSALYQYANATNGTDTDLYSSGPSTFAPGINLGAIAYTFTPSPSVSDWTALGSLLYTGGGGELQMVVADTYYSNNVGSYDVSLSQVCLPPVSGVPEPAVVWLTGLGLVAIGWRKVRK